MATSIQELEQYRANPRVQQMLTLISRTEGTFGAKDPYAVYGGNINNQLSSLARHPGQGGSWSFRWNDGRKGTATASGRYQMIAGTWNGLARRYGFSDFGPVNQDLAAIALMKDAGALNDVINGNWQAAMQKLGRTWASLPSSPYAQAKRSQAEFDRMLAQTTGGVPAAAPTGRTSFTMPKLSDTATAPTSATAPQNTGTGLGILAPAALSKDELTAIMPDRITAPRVTDTFFEPVKVDWRAYYK